MTAAARKSGNHAAPKAEHPDPTWAQGVLDVLRQDITAANRLAQRPGDGVVPPPMLWPPELTVYRPLALTPVTCANVRGNRHVGAHWA